MTERRPRFVATYTKTIVHECDRKDEMTDIFMEESVSSERAGTLRKGGASRQSRTNPQVLAHARDDTMDHHDVATRSERLRQNSPPNTDDDAKDRRDGSQHRDMTRFGDPRGYE